MTCLRFSLLPGHTLCATMELGSPEGSYLELLNSDADPLHLYHLYDQMDLAGEEEIELNSGGPCSLGPLLAFSILLAGTRQLASWRKALAARQNHGQLPALAKCTDPQPRHRVSSHPMGFPLAETDMDTINCDQFSKLLQDMEMDEETREAYANIGKEAAEARERTEKKSSFLLISLDPSYQNHS